MGKRFFTEFTYQESLGDKSFIAFNKPINENFQWVLLLHSSGGLIWSSFFPKLLIISTKHNKRIKPKDVCFQELLFLKGYSSDKIVDEGVSLALQVQEFTYINHYINRYIEWMEDKLLKVIGE